MIRTAALFVCAGAASVLFWLLRFDLSDLEDIDEGFWPPFSSDPMSGDFANRGDPFPATFDFPQHNGSK